MATVKARAQITLSSIRDVQATYRYYLLQSSTLSPPAKPTENPPSGAWADTQPGYTAGSTNSLYFVDLTVFSDGDFSYSEVSLSSSYEAAKDAWNKAQNASDSVEDVVERTSTLETSVEQISGQITSKVWQTDITTITDPLGNRTSELEQKYSQIDQTVNNISITVGSLQDEMEQTAAKLVLGVDQSGTAYLTGDAERIHFTAGQFSVDSSYFTLDSSGNIKATSGSIGGWTIDGSTLYSVSNGGRFKMELKPAHDDQYPYILFQGASSSSARIEPYVQENYGTVQRLDLKCGNGQLGINYDGSVYINGGIVSIGSKAQIKSDGEGGNFRLEAPDTYSRHWEIDAHNGNLRIYTMTNDNQNYRDIVIGTDGNLNIGKSDSTESQVNVSNTLISGRLVASSSGNFGLYDASHGRWVIRANSSGNVYLNNDSYALKEYITSSGTSGNWRYWKWSGGLAMCIHNPIQCGGDGNVYGNAWGSIYSSDDYVFSAYPFAFVGNVPAVYASRTTADNSTYNGYQTFIALSGGSLTTPPRASINRGTAVTIGHPYLSLVAIGRWR